MCGGLRADPRRMCRVFGAMDHIIVDAILDVCRAVLGAEKSPAVGFVFSEQELRLAFAEEPTVAIIRMINFQRRDFAAFVHAHPRLARVEPPGPNVAKPKGGEK